MARVKWFCSNQKVRLVVFARLKKSCGGEKLVWFALIWCFAWGTWAFFEFVDDRTDDFTRDVDGGDIHKHFDQTCEM
jgi:hypothetical protein